MNMMSELKRSCLFLWEGLGRWYEVNVTFGVVIYTRYIKKIDEIGIKYKSFETFLQGSLPQVINPFKPITSQIP
jgi:hypothetical protein